jgi:hypothetical protein
MQNSEVVRTKFKQLPIRDVGIRRWRAHRWRKKDREVQIRIVIEVLFSGVAEDIDRSETEPHFCESGDVIAVTVGQDAERGLETVLLDEVEHRLGFVRAIDDPTSVAAVCVVAHDVAVRLEVAKHEAVDLEGHAYSVPWDERRSPHTAGEFRYSSAMRIRLTLIALVALPALIGCDTISSDFSSFADSFTPPTPQQAAQWAADPNDRENARRGTILLANAPWGGAAPYVRMYRLYAEDALDPLVRAASLQALGRHGDPDDAALVAKSLASPFRQVRLAAAKALQRLHDPAVADTIWPRLVDANEDSDVRTEIAIALGQYPTPAVFQALVSALSQRDLAVNVAAVDALRTMTGMEFAIDEDQWLRFYVSTPTPFANGRVFLYPTFVRAIDIWDDLLFWSPVVFEKPDVPIGMKVFGARRTNDTAREAADPAATVPAPADASK